MRGVVGRPKGPRVGPNANLRGTNDFARTRPKSVFRAGTKVWRRAEIAVAAVASWYFRSPEPRPLAGCSGERDEIAPSVHERHWSEGDAAEIVFDAG